MPEQSDEEPGHVDLLDEQIDVHEHLDSPDDQIDVAGTETTDEEEPFSARAGQLDLFFFNRSGRKFSYVSGKSITI